MLWTKGYGIGRQRPLKVEIGMITLCHPRYDRTLATRSEAVLYTNKGGRTKRYFREGHFIARVEAGRPDPPSITAFLFFVSLMPPLRARHPGGVARQMLEIG